MRIADHPKKLGLLLLPLIPLTAIGIVEVLDAMTTETACCRVDVSTIERTPVPPPAPPPVDNHRPAPPA